MSTIVKTEKVVDEIRLGDRVSLPVFEARTVYSLLVREIADLTLTDIDSRAEHERRMRQTQFLTDALRQLSEALDLGDAIFHEQRLSNPDDDIPPAFRSAFGG